MRLYIPKNEVIKQSNYNFLVCTKSDAANTFIVETPKGIGTLYSLGIIHGTLASVTLSVMYESDLKYENNTQYETVIIDVYKHAILSNETITQKMKESGFSRIIIVRTTD